MDIRFFMTAKAACVDHQTDAPLVCVTAYASGFVPIYSRANPARLNADDMTQEVIESALYGSAFGWDTPAATLARQYIETRRAAC